MRVWFSRLLWKVKSKRQVRLQLDNDRGAIDGVLIGIHVGHYVLKNAYFYAHRPGSEGEEMIGETWVLKEKVLLLNVKA